MPLAIVKTLFGSASDFSMKHAIHTRLAGVEKPRPHFPLRASDLLKEDYEFCPREHAFMDLKLAQKKGSFVGTAQRMTYDHGHYMEDQIRNNYLRDITVGNWECGICAHVHKDFGHAPETACPSCGWNTQWKYREPRFADPETDVSGGTDLLLQVKKPKLLLAELKTMAPDPFKELVAPLSEHRSRTALYLYLASVDASGASQKVGLDQARILYVMKSFGVKDESLKAVGIKDSPFSPFKEFSIKADPKLNRTPLGKAKVLKTYRDDPTGPTMPCGICPNQFTKRAQACPAGTACWSGKYPNNLTWLEGGKPKHAGRTLITLKEIK